MNTQILRYIKSIIEDDYLMEVLYFCLRRTMSKNKYTLKHTSVITISNKFVEESVSININQRFSTQADSFALLLSVRALMIDKQLLKYCEGDNLLFTAVAPGKYGWIDYISYLLQCLGDPEFKKLYALLKKIHRGDELTTDDMDSFIADTVMPEFRNLQNYYKDLAKQRTGVTGEVICNNAFVNDERLTDFDVKSCVAYIGNTAFSYCPNLRIIRFAGPSTLFGKFPIIECRNLECIIVPEGSEDYYKKALPYYERIIVSKEPQIHELEVIAKDILTSPQEEYLENGISHNSGVKSSEESNLIVCQEKESSAQPPIAISIEVSDLNNPKCSGGEPEIEIRTLKNVFDKKVTSYKYFWMMAILTLLREKGMLAISFKDLVVRMSSEAWPIVLNLQLDFGSSDMLHKYLSDVMSKLGLQPTSSRNTVESLMKTKYDKVQKCIAPLLKNVPYRFLSPWIKYVSDADVIEKSHSREYNGLYAIEKDCIVIDEDWYDYLMINYDEVTKFVRDSLLIYLKQHNSPMALLKFMSAK